MLLACAGRPASRGRQTSAREAAAAASDATSLMTDGDVDA